MSLTVATSFGCASAEPEMIPVDRVVNYTERASYDRPATWNGRTLEAKSPYEAKCRKLRENIEVYQTAYLASLGVGAVGVVLGLLSGNDVVEGVAGAAAVASTVAQVGAWTGAEMTAEEAREWGCELD
jgi:hypothetical protein